MAKKKLVLAGMTTTERIDLAKKKMARVLNHFLYVVELHANNSFVVYSPTLVSQIPPSFAANAFNVFQRSMYQIEIVRLSPAGILRPFEPVRQYNSEDQQTKVKRLARSQS